MIDDFKIGDEVYVHIKEVDKDSKKLQEECASFRFKVISIHDGWEFPIHVKSCCHDLWAKPTEVFHCNIVDKEVDKFIKSIDKLNKI